jgi:HEPN domain-containing protein
MAISYLNEGQIRLKAARSAVRKKNFAFAIRQSQECVELSLKGVLRFVGIDPPKWHDVGAILKKEISRFPDWFKVHIDELASISRELRSEREPSMYGDSESNIPAKDLYTKSDAKEAFKKASLVASLCNKLFEQ